MYRLVLLIIARFPASYGWQTFALAACGLLLTPVIPSSNGRAVLSGPLVANLSEILRFRKGSAGSIGMSMAALLGFGHLSFMFMNGTATCLLAFGLLPEAVVRRVTWFSWLIAALVPGLVFFALSYCSILLLYRPKLHRASGRQVIQSQLHALGSIDRNEMITLLVVLASLLGFLTQSWHHVNSAWVALTSFFLLFSWGVIAGTGIDPFILCLAVLISGNPWFTSYQNSIYVGLMEATEGKLFDHHQTQKAALMHVLAAQVAIIVSIPYWKWLGLIK